MKISQSKEEKILEQIISFLYSISPRPAYTAHIAKELARDEEFIKKLLKKLKLKEIIIEINKNSKGKVYLKRARWRLSERAYKVYREKQNIN